MALQKWPNRGASNATPAGFMSTRRTQRRSFFVPSPSQIAEPSFVAVDFETANRMGGVSACQVAMVKVLDGQIVDRLNTLIRPPKGWDSFEFTYLHGISAADVADAPGWINIADTVSHFVDGATVYAHNAAFDSRVWRQLDEHFGTTTLPAPFFCSYRTAQRLIPGLPNYKLPTVLHACAPNYQLNHHRADSDAKPAPSSSASYRDGRRQADSLRVDWGPLRTGLGELSVELPEDGRRFGQRSTYRDVMTAP